MSTWARELTEDEIEEAQDTFAKLNMEGEWYALEEGYLKASDFPEGHELRHYARMVVLAFEDVGRALWELRRRASAYGIDSDPDV